ncbi:hypothetical protein N8817_07610 [Flavobacteriaceae bacterium]|nr:hypothetical protein [Flavobacteriaceae bacterium]
MKNLRLITDFRRQQTIVNTAFARSLTHARVAKHFTPLNYFFIFDTTAPESVLCHDKPTAHTRFSQFETRCQNILCF